MSKAAQDRVAPDMEASDNLGFLVHETARAITVAYGSMMAHLGLTRPQVRVLVWVDHEPGITQTELCDRMNASPMSVTGLLDRMEGKRLVKRVEDPADRRVKRIYLTDGALALKPDMEKVAAKFRLAVRQGLSPEEIATTVGVLTTMKANLMRIRESAQDDERRN